MRSRPNRPRASYASLMAVSDYYMAHSWLRLRQGKDIQKHDITMLNHELAEEKEMQDSLDVIYEDSHERVQKIYNYQKELLEYLKDHDV